MLHRVYIREEVIRDLRYRNVVNIEFVAFDKEQQQVEWTLKGFYANGISQGWLYFSGAKIIL